MRFFGHFTRTRAVGAASRLNALRLVVTGAFVCGMLISPRLWFGLGRTFPRAPLVNGLPAFLLSVDYWFALLLVAALVLAAISKQPRRYLIAAVALTGLLVIFDQTRLQPWVYQYAIMLAVLAGQRSSAADEAAEAILAANQLVIICLYFWSGAQKLNWSFGHEILPTLLESAKVPLPVAVVSALPIIGIFIAVCESLIGIGLLIRRTRRLAVWLALGMHLLVLLLLVAMWHNSVVWPWNIGMMLMVLALFWRSDIGFLQYFLRQQRGPGRASRSVQAVLIICGLAPALSFVGWWDMNLSAALYSGNTSVAVVHISEQVHRQLPVAAQSFVFTSRRGELMLPFYEWSLAELNAPPYPEPRVFRKLAQQMCAYAGEPNEIELIVRGRPSLLDGSYGVTSEHCPTPRGR